MTSVCRRIIKFAVIPFGLVFSHPSLAANNGSTWSGFYIGANAGYGWGGADNNLAITDGPAPAACHFCSVPIGVGGVGGNDLGLAQAAGSSTFNPKGFVGGAQLGYNWQQGSWVYGLEADFQSFDQQETVNSTVSLAANSASPAFSGCTACVGYFTNSVKADWLVTIRPRFGYVWNSALVYGTAGLAISRFSYAQTYSDNIFQSFPLGPGNGGQESASGSTTRVGWTVGGGIEYSVATNWSAKLEYLYVRFNGLSANGVLHDDLTPVIGTFANFSNNVDHFSSNIVRVGLNYKFDWH
jgi:outer membrane immunogenic protein